MYSLNILITSVVTKLTTKGDSLLPEKEGKNKGMKHAQNHGIVQYRVNKQ